MTQAFRQTIAELWRRAELGTPLFAADGSTSLNFDDVTLQLTTSPNEEELLVNADIGPLTDGLAADADRLQKILGLGFAFLATHDVLVSLDRDRLVVSGSYPLRAQDMARLSDILSDVVSAAETLARLMDHHASMPVQDTEPAGYDPGVMIFQP
ncbi:type III secretion system chaperone [Yoonia sp. BS5-3]|uniref:Type III secretion system chaperone n=1 Tax=Yoonia phaeophyticola TaxID=3137369 RepID=A0ABZ2V5M5_9RHOB